MDLHLSLAWSPGRGAPALEPALLTLLEAVDRLGSLQQAARAAGVSYRHAWGLMKKWEPMLGGPLLVAERGRGAALSPLGRALVDAVAATAAELAPVLARHAARAGAAIEGASGSATPSLVLHASHDLALPLLRDLLPAADAAALDIRFQGSEDNLADLLKGRCDVAGFHAPPGDVPAGLKPRTHVLVHFVTRTQGLMVAPGNPRRVRGLADLARRGVRFVNRQRGSGTRALLERLLDDAGVDPARIAGYDREEFTHLAVAATVASGMADTAFGLAAAAAMNHLDFLPVAKEHYLLACRRDRIAHPGFQRLLAVLRAPAFRRAVARLPGYDAAGAGQEVPASDHATGVS